MCEPFVIFDTGMAGSRIMFIKFRKLFYTLASFVK